jgi:tetratricopeptide (TPR) repeat protein
MAGETRGPAPVAAISFDDLLANAYSELNTDSAQSIKNLSQKAESAINPAQKAEFLRHLAISWQQNKQMPLAAYYFGEAAKLENSEKNLNFAGYLFLGLLHDAASATVKSWEAQQAISCFKRALELNPANDTAKIGLATVYVDGQGETMQGVQLLLGLTREKPDHIPANLLLGKLSVQSGQYDKAIGRFETVLKQEPQNTEALYFLAEAYKGKGNKDKAIELLEKCKKIVNKPEFSRDIDQYINSFK